MLVPLFSIPSVRAWGIGEIGDLPAFAAWVREAGHSFVQLLPVTEVASGETSPYSAMSAMAIDPSYTSLSDVPEFQVIGGEDVGQYLDRDVTAQIRIAGAPDHTHAALTDRLDEAVVRETGACRERHEVARLRAAIGYWQRLCISVEPAAWGRFQ